jgi:hypothetical protein
MKIIVEQQIVHLQQEFEKNLTEIQSQMREQFEHKIEMMRSPLYIIQKSYPKLIGST